MLLSSIKPQVTSTYLTACTKTVHITLQAVACRCLCGRVQTSSSTT